MRVQSSRPWTIEDAEEIYGVNNWSTGFFVISDNGEVMVRPQWPNGDRAVSLMEIVKGLEDRGLNMPVLLRFSDILRSRIATINNSFQRVMKSANYHGSYRLVYPIKVNQQQQVIDEIVAFGRNYHVGLEVGSKAELIAATALLNDPDAYIICNGYKDESYIQLGLNAQKIGQNILFVIEMPTELPMILELSERLRITPSLGIRAKLASKAGGHWSESGGDHSSFGLTALDIIKLVDELQRQGKMNCLKLLHYHLGSQIPDITCIRKAIQEASQFYVSLVKEGAPMGILNVGGGLAVDYDGSHTDFASSSNYTIEEYSADIIEVIMETMDANQVSHPTIISESGRAIVAYHSVLLFNILDTNRNISSSVDETEAVGSHVLLDNLLEIYHAPLKGNIQECYHDAIFYIDKIRSLFLHGSISLRKRAMGENIFWRIMMRIMKELRELDYVPEELQEVEASMADIYYGNFSVFQSLPDAWAINQLFPIMPIHRLSEFPTRNATLSDITCDSDGKISRFTDLKDVRKMLPIHELNGKEYYLGVFLVGAYQETLGDLHNLLGDPNVIGVQLDKDGQLEFTHEIRGDSVADVLFYMEYDPKDLGNRVRIMAEDAVRKGLISPLERKSILECYNAGLQGYTYYERNIKEQKVETSPGPVESHR